MASVVEQSMLRVEWWWWWWIFEGGGGGERVGGYVAVEPISRLI